MNQLKHVACLTLSYMLCTTDFEKIYLQLKKYKGDISKFVLS